MAPETKKQLDIEQVKTDLTELVEAYNKAFEEKGRNSIECQIVFEALCELGSQNISTAEGEEEKTAIQDVIHNLPVTGNPHHLYLFMLGWGVNNSLGAIMNFDIEAHMAFDSVNFECRFTEFIVKTCALTSIHATESQLEGVEAKFIKMAKEIANLPGGRRQAALASIEKVFTTEGTPETEGPQFLRQPGKRAHLYFMRMVNKFAMEVKDAT